MKKGIMLDDNQKWHTQITNSIASINSRLYLIKRLSNSISKNRLKKIADSLYTSKIRYGVQLYGNVRMSNEDPEQKLIGSIQVAQNKLARFLNVLEIWKSFQSETYPKKWARRND